MIEENTRSVIMKTKMIKQRSPVVVGEKSPKPTVLKVVSE